MRRLTDSRCRFPVRTCDRQCTVPVRRIRENRSESSAVRRPSRCYSDRNLPQTHSQTRILQLRKANEEHEQADLA